MEGGNIKRYLWLGAVALSVVFLALSLVGVVTVWAVRAATVQRINTLFDTAELVRARAAGGVERVVSRQQEALDSLSEVTAEIDRISGEVAATPVLFTALDRVLDGRLLPAAQRVDETARQAYGDISTLHATVNSLNNLSLLPQPAILSDIEAFLGNLLADMDSLAADMRAANEALRDRREQTVEAIVAPGQAIIARLDSRVTTSQARMQELGASLTELETRLAQARNNLLRWILLAAVLLTLALGWLAFSQYLAARYAWQQYKMLPAYVAPVVVATDSAG